MVHIFIFNFLRNIRYRILINIFWRRQSVCF
jgi:hypothetical protein